MPQPKPFTTDDLDARSELIPGLINVAPLPAKAETHAGGSVLTWDFREAIRILELANSQWTARHPDFNRHGCPAVNTRNGLLWWSGVAPKRAPAEKQLTLLCQKYRLTLTIGSQETDGRIAASYHQAARLSKRHKLPQSLEQAAWRLVLSTGKSFDECCRILEDDHRAKIRQGRQSDYALRVLVQGLQACASESAPCLPRRDVKRFILAVLSTAGICGSLGVNRSRLDRLMVPQPRPSKTSKTYL